MTIAVDLDKLPRRKSDNSSIILMRDDLVKTAMLIRKEPFVLVTKYASALQISIIITFIVNTNFQS